MVKAFGLCHNQGAFSLGALSRRDMPASGPMTRLFFEKLGDMQGLNLALPDLTPVEYLDEKN
jgi:hypothetical protein